MWIFDRTVGAAAVCLRASLAALTLAFIAPTGVSAQLAVQQEARGQLVTEVVVIGNRRIEAATVESYLALRVGEPITEAGLNRSVRQLFDTGLFRDAAVAPDGGRLLVQVVENPSINRINFEGNDLISDEQLLGIVSSRPRRPYTRSGAEADAQELTEAYRRTGRYGAVVEPVIIEQADNRVDLVFEIVEGNITEVYSINFVGNEIYSDRRLRNVIDTSESGIFSPFVNTDVYDPDRLEFDKQLLRRYYLNNGYPDFSVLSAVAELAPDREGFYITFSVEEGELYTFGELDITVNTEGMDVEDYRPILPNLAGDTYDASVVEDVIDDITFRAGQDGFAFTNIRPLARRNEEERVIDIMFDLAEGPRVYVDRIDIEGNDRTIDRVIRRQFDIVEGDAFNAREIEKARRRIRGLGFFSEVAVRTERGDTEDRARVKVEVAEQPTGSLSFGVGYSSASGPVGEVSVSERNLLGRGQFLRARVQVANDSRVFDLTFREPAFLDRDLSAGFNIFYRDEDLDQESDFQLTSIGFEPSIGFPVSENARMSLFYQISDTDIRDIDATTSPLIARDEGSQTTSAIGARYTLDLRNDPLEPTGGYLLTLEGKAAGLGGGARYGQAITSAKTWTSFFDNEVVASAEVEAGGIFAFNSGVRVTDRFFLGGDEFRGFAFGGLGPRDIASDDALGGNYYAVLRTDISFPLGLPEELGFYGGLFADVGTVWHLDRTSAGGVTVDDSAKLRASVGTSIFWDSSFGPLRLNFAVPLKKEQGDDTEFFRFTVGTRF